MSHARVEEVSDSDSDPDVMDPSQFDPGQSILSPADIPSFSSSSPPNPNLGFGGPGTTSAGAGGVGGVGGLGGPGTEFLQPRFNSPRTGSAEEAATVERTRSWQCLYPVYFDANRSRADGRRVGKDQAVANPLAREIVDAVAGLGLHVVFEPGKVHPKDWSNPGRVRVLVKEGGVAKNSRVKNKHHLYTIVSEHLKAHPTTENSPMRLRVAGLPTPNKAVPPPAIPRGWKMGSILPLHSPAMSGGGVSDDFLKQMMGELSGSPAGGGSDSDAVAAGAAGGSSKKKDKKKKGKA
ncbi:signal recognition particle, SRP19 subunit [Xylona heveae TC161]|uniref:Signal recognition particle, SRP19 subunit n=1 Tax=Xylona heveae (strain CBS 132557 / TC161) TaxID=1328760 RepID=A0A165HVJ6_XYLHT|nr:signal recognition particle, SRP19 subunit [Xylona heveae TC161]KZF23981.1 signal recognition particle, SRP19 subunit [Xylona heveae TC161]